MNIEDERLREYLKTLLDKIDIQPAEKEKDLDVRQWYDLWRGNHRLIREILRTIPLEQFPFLGTHGANKGGLEYTLDGKPHKDDIFIWANFKKPADTDEAAAMLYSLASSGITHSKDEPRENSGGFIVIDFGTELINLEKEMDSVGRMSLQNTRLTENPDFAVPADNEPGWVKIAGDDESELRMFYDMKQLQSTKDLATCVVGTDILDRSTKPAVSSYAVLYARDIPAYDIHTPDYEHETAESIIHSYTMAFMERVQCQAAVKIMLQKMFNYSSLK